MLRALQTRLERWLPHRLASWLWAAQAEAAPMQGKTSWTMSSHAALLFVIAYMALDAVSFLHPFNGLNITPWNPAPALGIVFAVRWGSRVWLPMILSLVFAEWLVRGWQQPVALTFALAVLLTLVYSATGRALADRLHGRVVFTSHRELLHWLLFVCVGVLLAGSGVVVLTCLAGLLPLSDAGEAWLHYVVGDAVGILLFLPLLDLLLSESGRRELRATLMDRDGVGLLLCAILVLWLAFGLGAGSEFKYLYSLFLPVIWAGIRRGLAGAVIAVAFLQSGIIVAGQILGFGRVTVLEIQVLTLALGLVGFFIGVVIDELRLLNQELHQSMRLAAAGEMAGALAHELNQPLTALAAYGKACEIMIRQGKSDAALQDVIGRIGAECRRATDVLHRLRDFFRSGSTRLEKVDLAMLVADVEQRLASRLHDAKVECTLTVPVGLEVLADRLQIEVVLRNLLANALEAVAGNPPGERLVMLSAAEVEGHKVLLQVVDNGPGVGEMAGRVFEPFVSNKGSGMGLGLAISRAIVENHGGELWCEEGGQGVFKLLLPLEGDHG